MDDLTEREREQIGEILKRRANDIASFANELRGSGPVKTEIPGSVELALHREVNRLRNLEARVNPPKPEPED